ncbi:polysaccharide deacetylase family protein [Paenibacillus nitricinens]|jgi:peptidoglycan/xylan/chitin deacetylase (PgdA/CDA1 family)|uniref:polysaccharide deacetylase family protein n=1 Tax=Paenibacillus nitricinens TaxID=3367691 RepID=UPI0033811D50
MAMNEPSAVLMIELLSLEHEQAGYQIEIGLTRDIGYARRMLTIDEFTYEQLNALAPYFGERMRLSLYPKWDPFRNSYYSTLVIMNQTFSETLYFACSEYYVSQLLQLKELDDPHVHEEIAVETTSPSIPPARRLRKKNKKRFGRLGLQSIVLASCLVVVLSLRMGGQVMDRAEGLKGPSLGTSAEGIEKMVSLPFIPPIGKIETTPSQQEEPAPTPETSKPSPEPSEPPQEQMKRYEEIKLTGDKYTYSLPKGYVALSFDDGPSKYTKEIVDILVEHEVAATFLFVGNKVSRNVEAVKYASEHQMSIGSHSWDHSKMTDNGVKENQNNLAKANQALEQITQSPITVFRPPYGAINDKLAANVTEQQMKVLLWNRDSEDWKRKTPEDVIQFVHHTDPSGAVYLFHEKKITVEALPAIIQYLKGKNMKFVIFK